MVTEHTHGRVEPGFEPVAAAFEANCAERGEVGAAFAAYHDGARVVDLWGGVADSATGRPWESDTLQPVFSGTKGVVAICLAMLIDRGQLDLQAPVARYWPEFAAAGKAELPVRDVVAHTAGLPGIRARELKDRDLVDDRLMAELLAAEAPAWEPGSTLCYHPLTYGWLCGELVRRIDGRTVGAFLAEEIAVPLGLELWIGLPAEHEDRVATMELDPGWGRRSYTDPATLHADPLRHATWGNPPILTRGGFDWNAPAVHRAEVPGANGIGHVRAIARLYGCLDRVLSPRAIENGARELARGRDPLTDEDGVFGAGFALQTEDLPFGPPADAFGHGGAGGSSHGAWPSHGVGFSYAMNQMRDVETDERPAALLRALFHAIGA